MKTNMNAKRPTDFPNHDEWLAYVRENVAGPDQRYLLASGRTELFKNFYTVHHRPFPLEFSQELEDIRTIVEPERTSRLEELNNQIFAAITGFLFDQMKQTQVRNDALIPVSSRERIEELLAYLAEKNPFFALWIAYKEATTDRSPANSWEEHVSQHPELGGGDDKAFTRVMAELDRVLLYFHDQDLSLPKYFFERCWFLHHLHGPERMLQTRALLNTLTAEIGPCASA